ncbi:MAG: ABC transporter permease subunit [Defluviitaleaceae bacterium]|nr:ABC transporter permease subunit [Defluviitaleaceae bacterium]MCL2836236.1 ABC transporter permease subunit [Defluviitaleaceae bacterium]
MRTGKKKSYWKIFLKNKELLLLTLPALVYFAVFHYLPMGGIYIAFTNYRFVDGIFGSEFVGLRWFRIFFQGDLFRVTRNTVLYSMAFIVLSLVTAVFTAILMSGLKSRKGVKVYQTTMILPNFMSWIVVSLVLYVFLDPAYGFINSIHLSLGYEDINWYANPGYWPFILTFMNIWKSVGMGCVMYYAAMMGIDPSLYEAATIDGAGKMGRLRYITLPALVPLMTILTILAMGNLFRGDFGLFFSLPRDVGMLYSTTDVLDTYIFRGLRAGRFSLNTAAGLLQSVMGFIMVVVTNLIVKKINPENSLF